MKANGKASPHEGLARLDWMPKRSTKRFHVMKSASYRKATKKLSEEVDSEKTTLGKDAGQPRDAEGMPDLCASDAICTAKFPLFLLLGIFATIRCLSNIFAEKNWFWQPGDH